MTSNNPRLVCCTDFSANARSAADVAAALARMLQATLVLVHVADETNAHAGTAAEFKNYLQPVRRRLGAEAKRLGRDDLRVEKVLLSGRWAEEAIVEYLSAEPPALVVVASVSKTAFDRWTIGSVSERIAQRSPAPTLVVRSPEKLIAWARQETPLKLFIAADFSRSTEAALGFVNELRRIGACEVTVAHMNWPPDSGQLLAPGESLELTKNPPAVQRRLLRKLEKLVSAHFDPAGAQLRVQPAWGRPDAALASLATELAADLVVVGAKQFQGLRRLTQGSVSRGLLHHAATSVACVPASAATAPAGQPPSQFRRVLVATDFSAAGDASVAWACAALPAGGVVKLVHVLPSQDFPGALVPDFAASRSGRESHRRFVAEAGEKLRRLVPPGAAARGIVAEFEVVESRNAAHAICRAAELFDADLVCLGTRGRSTFVTALLGSVAHQVMERSSCPVMVVRPPDR